MSEEKKEFPKLFRVVFRDEGENYVLARNAKDACSPNSGDEVLMVEKLEYGVSMTAIGMLSDHFKK